MIEIIFNTTKTGLETIMRQWEIEALRYIWSKEDEIVLTKDVWEHVSPLYDISRTSINQFLKKMTNAGILENRPQTGKGGIHGRYSPNLDEATFKGELVKTVLNNLMESFPKATWEQIKAY